MQPSFVRHALIYAAGNFLLQAGSFLLLPLYLHCLSREEFGTLEVLRRFAEVVLLLLLCAGVRQALITFHGQGRDDRERSEAIGSALLLTSLALLLGGGAMTLLAAPLGEMLGAGDSATFRLGLLAVFLEVYVLLLLAIVHVRFQAGLYVAVTLIDFLLRSVLSVVFVVPCHWGLAGVLLASVISSGCVAAWLVGREVARGVRFSGAQARAMAWFALPFVPGGLGFFLLNNGDRFFLLRYGTAADVGVYALGYKLALVVNLFSRSPLYLVWSNRMYAAALRPDAPEVFGRVFSRILGVYLFVGLGVCLFAPDAVALLGGERYAAAVPVVAPVVLAYFFLAAADLMEAGLYVRRRTALKLPVTVVSTATMLGLYAWLIPVYLAYGAALATLGGFIVHAALTGLLTSRVFPVRYEWGRLAGALSLTLGMWAAGTLFPRDGVGIAGKVLLCLGWLAIAWTTGLLQSAEKEWLGRQAGRAWASVSAIFPSWGRDRRVARRASTQPVP